MDLETADSLLTLTGGLTGLAELNSRLLAMLRRKGVLGDGEIDKLISDAVMGISEKTRPAAKMLLDGVKRSAQP
jgi:hypothetical protein